MIYFFQKKKFLVDYLGGLVDIHNHILPGIDDGAKNIEESLGLIKAFGEIGITRFIATPHIMPGVYPNTPATIKEAHNGLKSALLLKGLNDVSINSAAEHMIDQEFNDLIDARDYMPLNESYLLVECSFIQKPLNFRESVMKITSSRLLPVLAHPERYSYFNNHIKSYEKYRQQGIYFQCNLLSFGGYYGKDIQKKAVKMLEDGIIDFVASDAHNLYHIKSLKEIHLSERAMQKLLPVINNTVEVFY